MALANRVIYETESGVAPDRLPLEAVTPAEAVPVPFAELARTTTGTDRAKNIVVLGPSPAGSASGATRSSRASASASAGSAKLVKARARLRRWPRLAPVEAARYLADHIAGARFVEHDVPFDFLARSPRGAACWKSSRN